MDKKGFVAVFDSGVGGISVLREMVRLMPQEDFLYYGDSKHAPYGTKTTEEVRRMTIAHTEEFMRRGAKAVAIACNTATSAAVRTLREMYSDLPLVGIEPALKPAAEQFPRGRILVMATPMTIREEKFHALLGRYADAAEIYPLACPGLMEYVESGRAKDGEVERFLHELLKEYEGRVDAVVLGCTHYPFVKKQIAHVLGDDVRIFDGGYGTAKELKRRMKEAGILEANSGRTGSVVFENSDPDPLKIQLCNELLNEE